MQQNQVEWRRKETVRDGTLDLLLLLLLSSNGREMK